MPDKIIVAWAREKNLIENQHPLTGYLEVQDQGQVVRHEEFNRVFYNQVIARLSNELRANPHLENVTLVRLEADVEMPLDVATIQLIREDPVAYIRRTSAPAVVFRPQSEVKVSDELKIKLRPVEAGYDAMANTFGSYLFTRRKGEEAECIGCGRWVELLPNRAAGPTFRTASCDCGHQMYGTTVRSEREWLMLNTEEVLSVSPTNKRYYLPRTWNTNGPWISHGDLQQKFEQYQEEKSKC